MDSVTRFLPIGFFVFWPRDFLYQCFFYPKTLVIAFEEIVFQSCLSIVFPEGKFGLLLFSLESFQFICLLFFRCLNTGKFTELFLTIALRELNWKM